MSLIFNQGANRLESLFKEVLEVPQIRKKFTNFWGEVRLPKLKIVRSNELNACAYQHNNKMYVEVNDVAANLSDEAIKALYCHELCHIIHKDFHTKTVASGLVATILLSAITVISIKISYFLLLLAIPSVLLSRALYWRVYVSLELRADSYSARYFREGMREVLQTLSREERPANLFLKFFSSHPSAQIRLEKL